MAYSELIKNFDNIRDYMREFYVYGFKCREEYNKKSARSYDDERRRIESWLGCYMGFRRTQDGKNVFISVDSRAVRHNPLYKAWKAKSFTAGDITLHFLLFDILGGDGGPFALQDIMEAIDACLSEFCEPRLFDASTVRKKLKEYEQKGLICTEKQGKTVFYRRAGLAKTDCPDFPDLLDFFSETAPCGVIGSFLLDKTGAHSGHFSFKHHYITQALDSGILCAVFGAIRQKQTAEIETVNRRTGKRRTQNIVPLRVFVSVQSGRQYVMAYSPQNRRIQSLRLDMICRVIAGEVCGEFDELRETLDRMQGSMWGVSTQGSAGRLESVEFTVHAAAGEEYIHRRLEREKRCGQVERLDAHRSRFRANVYDASELIPWIRTFICRIISLNFSNKALEKRFWNDLEAMYRLYGLWDEMQIRSGSPESAPQLCGSEDGNEAAAGCAQSGHGNEAAACRAQPGHGNEAAAGCAQPGDGNEAAAGFVPPGLGE